MVCSFKKNIDVERVELLLLSTKLYFIVLFCSYFRGLKSPVQNDIYAIIVIML